MSGYGTPYSLWLREQGLSGQANTLAGYRALYRGERDETFRRFVARFISTDVDLATDRQNAGRNLLTRNELGVVMRKRITPMPSTVEYKANEQAGGKPEVAEALNVWAANTAAGVGISLCGLMGSIARDQERDGNAALVMAAGDNPKVPTIALRDTEQAALSVDPITGQINGSRFTWGCQYPGGERLDYEHTIDKSGAETLTANGKPVRETSNGLGFFPLVLIPRDVDHGSPVGVSGVAGLEESYLDFLWAAYLMNVANKLEGFGVYCPPVGADIGAFFDANGKVMNSFKVSPGCWYPFPLSKVGGGINIASIVEQYDRAEATLYRLAMVKRDRGESSDMRSGKAMIIDTQELRDYIDQKLCFMRCGLERVGDMAAWFMGLVPVGQPAGMVVEFDALDAQDAQENTKRAELWLKLALAGRCTKEQMFRAWQRLALIDEDADIDAMAEESDGAESTMLESLMDKRAARQTEAQPKSGNGAAHPDPEYAVDGDGMEGGEMHD